MKTQLRVRTQMRAGAPIIQNCGDAGVNCRLVHCMSSDQLNNPAQAYLVDGETRCLTWDQFMCQKDPDSGFC